MTRLKWCIEQHSKTNHWYDQYLPYEFHLRMVYQAAKDFSHLLDDDLDYYGKYPDKTSEYLSMRSACLLATWGHDLIEDCRVSYNDVKDNLGEEVADIIFACTNEKGKNRSERANEKYYKGIRNTPGAIFVKLCDRIANVQYSKMTKSRMFEMYKKENDHFMEQLGYYTDYNNHQLKPMFVYLENLFNG